MKYPWYVFILLSLGSWYGLFGQKPNLQFTHFTPKDNLSQGTIITSLQDSRGFIWLGTADGLNRYDGYEFEVFRHDPKTAKSISDNEILSLAEDQEGNIWVGTANGLNKYLVGQDSFVHFFSDKSIPHSLSNNYVTSLFLDSNNNLWIGTKHGLNKALTGQNTFKVFFQNENKVVSIDRQMVCGITEHMDQTIWVGFKAGLFALKKGEEKLIPYQSILGEQAALNGNGVSAMLFDHKNQFWVGTEAGLNFWNEGKRKFDLIPDLKSTLIKSILRSSTDYLWIGTNNGLWVRDPKMEFHPFRHQYDDIQSLSNNDIFNFLEDKQGTIWIGTGSGLNKYSPYLTQFHTIRISKSTLNDLTNNKIWAITKDRNNHLWIGTEAGLLVLNESGELLKSYDQNFLGLVSNNISSIREDKNGIFWLGTLGGGLIRFDSRKEQFRSFLPIEGDSTSLISNIVRSIAFGPDQTIWVGTSKGLCQFDKATEKFSLYRFNKEAENLKANSIRAIFSDSRKMLWIGTEGGLICFEPRRNNSDFFKHDPSDPRSLSHDFVRTIHETRNGQIWIGTSGGLNLFNRKEKTFQSYRMSDGLPNDVVYAIKEDLSGNLWLSTNKGLSKFNPPTGKFHNFDAQDGLQGNEFNSNSSYQDATGTLYFGGINGFNTFNPNDIKLNLNPPKVILTQLDYVSRDTSMPIKQTLLDKEQINLSHQNYLFTFHFTTLDFTNPQKNQYFYKLEGFEEYWNQAGNRRMATYTNVPGGHYIFKVKAKNNHGAESKIEATIKIYIKPPFWATNWFLFSSILLSLILVIGFTRYRTYRIKRQNISLEKTVKDRTLSLEAQKRALENSEAQIRSMVNSIEDVIYAIDTKRNLIIFNKKAKKWMSEAFGVQLDIGQDLSNLGKATDACQDFFRTNYQKAFSGVATEENYELHLLNGEHCHYVISFNPIQNNTGRIIGCVVYSKDISLIIQAEQKVRDNEALFRSFYEESPIGIAYIKKTEHTISNCNKQLCEMLGYTEEELLGKTIMELTYPDDLVQDIQANRNAIQNKQNRFYNRNKRLVHKDGHIVYTSASISFFWNEEEELDYQIILINDITEERLAQKKIKEINEQLLHAEKMASLGQLTAGIAHEINNPVNFIYSGVGGLRKNLDAVMDVMKGYDSIETPEDFKTQKTAIDNLKSDIIYEEVIEDIDGLMDAIKDGAERTQEIVKSLQSFSRVDKLNKQMANIHDGLNSTIRILQKQLNDHITLSKEFDLSIPEIECFPGQLNQVFLNILLNAIQAIGPAIGHIIVKTENHKDQLKIIIQDDGPGIPTQLRSRIFEPFFTTKEVGKGTGLGLSISYGIIKEHQGKISVKSSKEKGTIFTILLPKKPFHSEIPD